MRKHLQCEANGKAANIAWLSLQPDGSISFGLNDRTFISPRFNGVQGVWSAFNRIETQYLVQSSPNGLQQVKNPHFTYHPNHWLQLRANAGEILFRGLTDVPFVLRQDGTLRWIRAISRPVYEVLGKSSYSTRTDGVDIENWCLHLPHIIGSIRISVDFFPMASKYDGPPLTNGIVHEIEWHGINVRLAAQLGPAQIATLSWYHAA